MTKYKYSRSTLCTLFGSVCRGFIICILIAWVASATYFYQQDFKDNVTRVDGKIISRNTFTRGYIYTVSYEFQPIEEEKNYKGSFVLSPNTFGKAGEYNLIYSFGSNVPIYYRKVNPYENSISEPDLYDSALLANLILSAIGAGIGIPIFLCMCLCKSTKETGASEDLEKANDCLCCWENDTESGDGGYVFNRRWKSWVSSS